MLSGVSAFLSCEYRVLSWRYCTVWIYRGVCTQLQVCNLVLVCDSWRLWGCQWSLFATAVVPKGAQCHKELYRHRSSRTFICVSIVNIWTIFCILQFPFSCICHSASLFKTVVMLRVAVGWTVDFDPKITLMSEGFKCLIQYCLCTHCPLREVQLFFTPPHFLEACLKQM